PGGLIRAPRDQFLRRRMVGLDELNRDLARIDGPEILPILKLGIVAFSGLGMWNIELVDDFHDARHFAFRNLRILVRRNLSVCQLRSHALFRHHVMHEELRRIRAFRTRCDNGNAWSKLSGPRLHACTNAHRVAILLGITENRGAEEAHKWLFLPLCTDDRTDFGIAPRNARAVLCEALDPLSSRACFVSFQGLTEE